MPAPLQAKAFVLCIPLRVGAWAESYPSTPPPFGGGALAERVQSTGATLAAEAGSGERDRPGPIGSEPRATELRPATVQDWRKWRSLRLPREDRGDGGAGEGALHPLRSRELPAGGGEGVLPGVSWGPGLQRGTTQVSGVRVVFLAHHPRVGASGASLLSATFQPWETWAAPLSLFTSAHTR